MTQKFDFALIATLRNLNVKRGQKQDSYNNAMAEFVRACALITTTNLLGAKQINLFK